MVVPPPLPLRPHGFGGQVTYASPERWTNRRYAFANDIFFLGLIQFEVLCPFTTTMECDQTLRGLRQGVVSLVLGTSGCSTK